MAKKETEEMEEVRPFLVTELERKGKFPVHPENYNGVAFPGAVLMTDGGFVNYENVMQYEFYNLSNVPVLINGMFLDRYFAGSPTTPTYLNTRYFWIPKMLANETDTSNYSVQFLDNFYNGIKAVHKLYIMKKLFAPVPKNRR